MCRSRSEANVGFQDHVLLDHLISDLPKKGVYNLHTITSTDNIHVHHVDDRSSSEVYATGGDRFIKEPSLYR